MKLSFVLGQLYLDEKADGSFLVTLRGQEILRTRSRKAAVEKFNQMRREMEAQFPPQRLSPEDQRQAFRTALGDWMVKHNSLGGRTKKTTAKSTRTFGS